VLLDSYPLPLINGHENAMGVWEESSEFLGANEMLASTFARHFWAFRAIEDLIPQTLENFGPGHFFPYTEAYSDLEVSFELAAQRFYKSALVTLRSFLELGLLGPYFAARRQEHVDAPPWLASEQPTPKRSELLRRLRQMEHFETFDQAFDLVPRIRSTSDKLDGFAHTRGRRHSAWTLSTSNVNTFAEDALLTHLRLTQDSVRHVVITILLTYPLGLCGLPLDDKFGLNGPVGGFLRYDHVQLIESIILANEVAILREIALHDSRAQEVVTEIHALPDITPEELEVQSKELNRFMKESST
jgi:hypothetical protein